MKKNTDNVYRLDRLLTALALFSRSEAQRAVRLGRVRVNGAVCADPGAHPPLGSEITLDDQPIDARVTRHVMLNKPCGVLTAARDGKQKTVLDLLPPAFRSLGCMPVGRLDKDTEGLLLFTTDGALAHLLLSPKRHVWKCYQADVDGALDERDAAAFAKGIPLSDFTALPARLEIVSSRADGATARVWVREGKFHQVRRMFEARGRDVLALKRLSFGPIALDAALAPGAYRELTEDEMNALQSAARGENDG